MSLKQLLHRKDFRKTISEILKKRLEMALDEHWTHGVFGWCERYLWEVLAYFCYGRTVRDCYRDADLLCRVPKGWSVLSNLDFSVVVIALISAVLWQTSKGIYQPKQIYQVILNEFESSAPQWPLNHSPCMRYQRQSKPTVDAPNVMRYAPCFKMSGYVNRLVEILMSFK
ncbi:hypothetical protein CEXT_196121 [Caerostris extrusa]|uniref:Uncharacterized protein n=1 Tax=Caerostris extrusa TaxID=172846 RepID=A0AAV4XDV2_CAEEX|nr:hypothetical protein CEXT_196121 [Caerostris extrusa]